MSNPSQKGTAITEEHFKFLLSNAEGKSGPGRLKLTTSEADRFVRLTNKMVNCLNWEKRVDKEIFAKVARIVDQASLEAADECDSGLPFQL